MVLKIGMKRKRDVGMLRPSRADLAAEAVLASLNCTRAWRHKTLFRRYHPDLSQKKMEKQILSGMAGDMATYI
jgi:1,6-anhydro-N-acetylmuramate kinase